MGLLRYVSASQIENYRKCPRYWWQKSILKLPEPKHPSAEKGTLIHKVAETYLKTGEFIGESEHVTVFKSGLSIFPTRGGELLLEHRFELPTYAGGPIWVGFIDIGDPRPKPKRVLDTKTRSDPRYFKTPEELLQDTQMMSYCKAALETLWGEDDAIEVAHLYMLTKRPYRAHRVPKASSPPAIATRAHVDAIWARDLGTVREMDDLLTSLGAEAKAEQIRPVVESCSMYGGCAFRVQCGLGPSKSQLVQLQSPAVRRAQLFQEPTAMTDAPKVSLKDRLAAKKAALDAEKAGTTPVVQNAPVASASPGAVATQAPVTTAPDAILPPDAPDRNERPPAAPQAVAEAPAASAPPKAPKAPKAAKAVTVPTQTAASVPAAPANGTAVATRKGFSIFVDTYPVKGADGPVVLFEDWIGPFAQAVAEENGVAHYGLMDFRNGPKALAALVAQNIDEVPGVLVMSSFAPAAHEILEVLIPHAARVTKKL